MGTSRSFSLSRTSILSPSGVCWMSMLFLRSARPGSCLICSWIFSFTWSNSFCLVLGHHVLRLLEIDRFGSRIARRRIVGAQLGLEGAFGSEFGVIRRSLDIDTGLGGRSAVATSRHHGGLWPLRIASCDCEFCGAMVGQEILRDAFLLLLGHGVAGSQSRRKNAIIAGHEVGIGDLPGRRRGEPRRSLLDPLDDNWSARLAIC